MITARRAALALLVAGVGVLTTACQGTTPYAIIVNGTAISQHQVLRELDAIGSNAKFVAGYNQSVAQAAASGQSTGQPPSIFGTGGDTTYSQSFTAVVLNTDVQAALIHDEVVRRHIEPAAADVTNQKTVAAAAAQFESDGQTTVFDAFNSWFRHIYEVRAAEEQALTSSLGPVDTSEKAVRRFYGANPTDFITTECVSHILVSSQAEASSVRAQIEAGATFAAMAKKHSTDTASAAKGGSLGCSAPGNYVAPFEKVADTIAVNQLSQPVQSQFGWHLIMVTSRTTQPLDLATAAKIVQYLQQQSPIALFLQAEQQHVSVHVNPSYGTWDPSTGVVPPTSPAANSGIPTTTSAAPAAPAPSTP